MNIVAVIPARMASSRFPGKPLKKICGVPMVGHVFLRTKMCRILKEVYVATCDEEIVDYIETIGGRAIMTSEKHERASDRVAEAMLKIEQETDEKIDILIMIQGDEPMVYPEMIEAAVQPLIENNDVQVVNLMSNIKTREEQSDPNEIKVVVDKNDFALYFSREPIPSWRKGAEKVNMLKQVCVIPFRRDFLLKFNELPQTELEIVESIDMLRVLENGLSVKMVYTSFETYSVDTSNDLANVEKIMKQDELFAQYKKLF